MHLGVIPPCRNSKRAEGGRFAEEKKKTAIFPPRARCPATREPTGGHVIAPVNAHVCVHASHQPNGQRKNRTAFLSLTLVPPPFRISSTRLFAAISPDAPATSCARPIFRVLRSSRFYLTGINARDSGLNSGRLLRPSVPCSLVARET